MPGVVLRTKTEKFAINLVSPDHVRSGNHINLANDTYALCLVIFVFIFRDGGPL